MLTASQVTVTLQHFIKILIVRADLSISHQNISSSDVKVFSSPA